MYYLANQVVSLFGVEGTVLIAFTGMLFVIYGVWSWLRNPPGRIWRQAVWIPALMGCYFSFSGWNDFTGLMAMLHETEAITSEQYRLLHDHNFVGSIRTICFGLAGTAFLWWFVRRSSRLATAATQPELTGAGKEEHAKPI